jgi:hypothetical protein
MPQQNSITSSPRWMSPFESAITLPCSDESRCASSSILAFDQRLEREHHARAALRIGRRPTRLRRLGGGHGAIELGLAAHCFAPVLGSNTSP